jgi:PAS domain S-box-containing protein
MVLEVALSLVANPIFARMAIVFLSAVIAFALAIVMQRVLRRRILEDDLLHENPVGESTAYPYTAVIQELKQQKFSLENEQQIQRRRARLSESITSAVIANLPCGILFLAPNGLVRQANSAARQLLGFASPLGMSIEDLFRNSQTLSESEHRSVSELCRDFLRRESKMSDFDISYRRSGESRVLSLAIIPLRSAQAECLGIGLVIRDETHLARLREAEILRAESSAELALDLRTSLATIREYVQQMSSSGTGQSTQQWAKVICLETERLERMVGGFLVENGPRKAFAAQA